MCGIVACYAKEGCYEKLLSALSRLEYRGYDSAGIALLCGGNFSVRKRAGGVSNLNGSPLPGDTGIGHTRWATHGAPTDVNAHPHLCGKFALVHNGIAENYAQLQAELAARGETFVSDSDSEVIVRLIARCYEGDFFAAVVAACARLQGAYAIAVLCADFPGEVVCARRGSPLVAGYAGGCPYVCSDVPALGGDAWFCPAEEGEFIRIRGGSLSFCDASGREIPKTFVRADASPVSGAPRQGSYMEREIAEIPSALARTLGGLRRLDFAPCAGQSTSLPSPAAPPCTPRSPSRISPKRRRACPFSASAPPNSATATRPWRRATSSSPSARAGKRQTPSKRCALRAAGARM